MDPIALIQRLNSLPEIQVMRENAKRSERLTPDIETAFRERELALHKEKVLKDIGKQFDSLQPIEQDVVSGLAALWMTSNRPNYSIRAVNNRKGDLVAFAADTVSKPGKSEGYKRLVDAGFGHLVFERIVLAYPEEFSASVLASARARLAVAEQEAEQGHAQDAAADSPAEEGRYSTAVLLAGLGFLKPTPYEWYALRGDEIVHLAWVEDADFEQGYARVFERNDDDRRPTYAHWRTNVQRILAGHYKAEFIVFGYRGPKNRNQQLSEEVVLYRMSDYQEVEGDVYASISPVTTSLDGAQTSPRLSPSTRKYAIAPVRPEQAAFRRALFERFDGRCAISGCQVAQLLDAAHLPGRNWAAGDNDANDGILLRADLHRALDSGLIHLDASLRVSWVAPSIHELYGHLVHA